MFLMLLLVLLLHLFIILIYDLNLWSHHLTAAKFGSGAELFQVEEQRLMTVLIVLELFGFSLLIYHCFHFIKLVQRRYTSFV